MDKIVPAFELSLFDPILSDACADVLETGIDSALDNGLLKSVPIVSVLVGVGKTAQNIHDRNLLRHTLRFINAFNNGSVNPEKLRKYRQKINEMPSRAEEDLGRVIILLNNNIDIKKSDVLGKLFRAYINEDLTWDQFCELSDVMNRIFISDIDLLLRIGSGEVNNTENCVSYQAERLNSLGLVDMVIQSLTFSTAGNNTAKAVAISELGQRLIKFGVKY